MSDFKLRTENIKPTKILDYYVETKDDRKIVNQLKSDVPIVLVGSRGVGKSFLLRVAEAELKKDVQEENVVPVYLSFTQGSMLQLDDETQFYTWMLAKMCSAFLRSIKKLGVYAPASILASKSGDDEENYLNRLIVEFEQTWKGGTIQTNTADLPSVDEFKETIEDICEEAGIDFVNFFVDEAAHILRPAQQRQFFSLYRDVNSPYINCNAAIYPGVTSFGSNFQPIHDATFVNLERDVSSSGYVNYMQNIVEKQAAAKILAKITKNKSNFAILAYAANGNPRILLRTLSLAPNVSSRELNTVVKEFYKSSIWEEHTLLAEKYSGFKEYIDWGRDFVEDMVLPELKSKNDDYLNRDKKTTRYFWTHKDAPERVKKALNLLCYTGIISTHTDAVKATRSEVGTRYSVNMGCLLSLENVPARTGLDIVRNITIKRMSEYGANHAAYDSLNPNMTEFDNSVINQALKQQLAKSVEFLALPEWLIERLKTLGLDQIGKVLDATEEKIQEASYYVGKVRSRYIKNEALSAVFEYLSG
ncbi:hypothetical protein S7335_3242 [Synechococcus sp. PCC 7335]|uniref:ORC-CDC6 family AAA ATPase n=1 Tax=Synechococcus sp. (strain ATCC 29403 / PCC 7335) TaxID=91464 RepID=UPI00017EBFED|nr:hypothetical protein [Synechococcus sp. PCC 7335]EDX85541.1 hypothetical protein S7335_3242 [Synechococcus sp. PCC 7335]